MRKTLQITNDHGWTVERLQACERAQKTLIRQNESLLFAWSCKAIWDCKWLNC